MPSRAIFIPARLESTRLPRKMLLPVPQADGSTKPLICVTAENALRADVAADVYVITDSDEIYNLPFQCQILKTAPAINGTARTFDAIRQLAKQGKYYGHIAIVQGDIPNIDPKVIPLLFSSSHRVTTLVTDLDKVTETPLHKRLHNWDLHNPSVVKAIPANPVSEVGQSAKIHYFTRSPVPYAMKHIGVYGINGFNLIRDIAQSVTWPFPTTGNCYIAEQEDLEQLNWINAGFTVTGLYVPRESAGTAIDTQADYDKFIAEQK